MDLIRVAKVDRLRLKWAGKDNGERIGTLHLTTHHLIFTAPGLELWLGYPMIHSAVLVRPPRLQQRRDTTTFDDWVTATALPPPPVGGEDASSYCESENSSGSSGKLAAWALEGSIKIRCHHFLFLTLRCEEVRQLYDIFATMKHLACVHSVDRLYAFSHREEIEEGAWTWGVYNPYEEYARMGVGSASGAGQFWRFTDINRGFALCPTYPPTLVVPAKISDTTLTYAAKYRSKCRLPVLCYLHPNQASMTRSSQPMVGLKQARSVQDEKLIEAILASSEPQGSAPRFNYDRNNIIIDARPTTNAVVNRAVGAGSENMEHYKRCRKVYLGIDNIHVMRDALNKVVDAIESTGDDSDRGVVVRIQGAKTNWLRHIENILVGVKTIVQAIDVGHHVVVHCSDGWDRTAQLTSLAQLCLDPYYRTIKGFAVLIEKEWVSFGHQFTLRCGHMGHPDRFKVSRAQAKRRVPQASADGVGATPPVTTAPLDEESGSDRAEDANSGSGYDFLQTSTSMFGRFASKALRGVQSRISSAIQAASDNLDDLDDPDPFLADYPDLQPNYMPASNTSGKQHQSSNSSSSISSSGGNASSNSHGGGFKFGRSKHDHETSPVFQQFLECVYQLWVQHPTMFEFNEELLLDLFYHLHSAQFGTFMGNNMRERAAAGYSQNTASIWTWVWRQIANDEDKYLNPLFGKDEQQQRQKVIVPDPSFIQYWSALFSCHDPTLKAKAEVDTVKTVDSNVWATASASPSSSAT
ncbi:phosphatidylinositol-3-phosphatase ymr1 [Coemansia sp. RSA 2673]|nr:phosphatidylinositol-3-phosphatase ymr1 [Coemansia sp. RSA 2673]